MSRIIVLKIKPPLIMTIPEADEALGIFDAAVNGALQKKLKG